MERAPFTEQDLKKGSRKEGVDINRKSQKMNAMDSFFGKLDFSEVQIVFDMHKKRCKRDFLVASLVRFCFWQLRYLDALQTQPRFRV